MKYNTILITGATGFIGSYLLDYFLKREYHIIALSRQCKPTFQHPNLIWISTFDQIQLQTIDYVINLAGENIGHGRWTNKHKKRLLSSRVETTHALYLFLEQKRIYPKCIISGSAVGYYGIDPLEQWKQICDEDAAPQPLFISELCQYWERAALAFINQNTKVIRLGVVLAPNSKILQQMLLPIRLNLFARIGHGRQPLVWIHIQDVLSGIEFLMHHNTQEHVFNLVAPCHHSQSDFARQASILLQRRPLFHLPSWLLKLIKGEQALLILNGQYVTPKALTQAGFKFKYPSLDSALIQLLSPK